MGKSLSITQKAAGMPIRVRVNELMTERFGADESLWPSVASLAKALGVNRPTVYAWLRGDVKGADFVTLDKWCKFFGVQPGDILVSEDE